MAVIYGYERFNNPTTKLVHVSAPVTGGAGATGNTGYTATSGLGSKDVGSIIKVVTAKTATNASTAPATVSAAGTVVKFTGTTSGNWKANTYYLSDGDAWREIGTTAPSGEYGYVLTNKTVVKMGDASYFLLAEIPVPADATDHCFVGVILTDQGMIDNLIPRRPLQDWAKQFYDLKTGGVK